MSDLTPLRELTTGVLPPPLEDLDRVLTRRQRRRAGALAACAAALVVAVTITGTTLFANDSSPDLIAPDPTSASPSPTESPTDPPSNPGDLFPPLTAEEIKAHPDATRERGSGSDGAPAGTATRIWSVCLAKACDGAYVENRRGEQQRALEVTNDGFATSALYKLTPASEVRGYIDDDWYLVTGLDARFVDGDLVAAGTPVGLDLVNARGDRRAITLGPSVPVTAIAGRPVFDGTSGLGFVDLDSATYHSVKANGGIWEWQSADDFGQGLTPEPWLWGPIWFGTHELELTRQGVLWRNPDGTFGVRFFDMVFAGHTTQALRAGVPGTMAVVDQGPPRIIHVSTDYGATWAAKLHPGDLRTGPGASQLPEDWESLPDAP